MATRVIACCVTPLYAPVSMAASRFVESSGCKNQSIFLIQQYKFKSCLQRAVSV